MLALSRETGGLGMRNSIVARGVKSVVELLNWMRYKGSTPGLTGVNGMLRTVPTLRMLVDGYSCSALVPGGYSSS